MRRARVMAVRDYTAVTEVPGLGASREQMSMLYTRYRTAATLCEGREVLEVACGAGLGLGYLARRARRVVGGDYTQGLLNLARRQYGNRIPLVQLDAHRLPFRTGTFDKVVLYEAIYYLTRPEQFLEECRRVLRAEGMVLLCTVNQEWRDLNPSPFSTGYISARGLAELLRSQGFEVDMYAAFPASSESVRDRAVSLIKRGAALLGLIPRTMKGRKWLKRLFFGRLAPIPAEVMDGMAPLAPLVPINGKGIVRDYKVLYAVGRLR